MSNDPTTSDDEKSVHQQCIDDPWERECAARDEAQLKGGDAESALQWADMRGRARPVDEATWPEEVLAAEVRRLREQLAELSDESDTHEAHAQHLKDRLKLPRNKLSAKLARVEAELAKADDDDDPLISVSDIRRALRDPQPPAASPEPQETWRGPWACSACGHYHQGDRLANICIGCPCPKTEPMPTPKGEPYNGY